MAHSSIPDTWNELIALRRPTLADVRTLAPGPLTAVFAHDPRFLTVAANLFVTCFAGQPVAPEACVVSASVVLAASFFHESACIRTVSLEGLQLLGCPVPCSAAAFLQHLRLLPAAVSTASSNRGFEIHVEKAITLYFPAPRPGVEPSQCPLASITYHYAFSHACPQRFRLTAIGA